LDLFTLFDKHEHLLYEEDEESAEPKKLKEAG